jgi:hypothetical protein
MAVRSQKNTQVRSSNFLCAIVGEFIVSERARPAALARLREAEIEDLHPAVGSHLQVGGLDVAVNDPRLVRRLGRDSLLLTGEHASERYLKRAAVRDFSILHLAAHAVADEALPDRSAVLLASGASDEDGLLQLREVVNLRLDGSVVILSACDTASGELLKGEGVLGLGRAFLQADARAVIGNLWPLRDDEAAALVGDLARHLARGESVGAAMRAARRDRIAAGAPATAWAGMVVLGDGDVVPFPGGSSKIGIGWRRAAGVVLLVALIAAALALLLHRKQEGL